MKLYKNTTLGASVDFNVNRIYFWGGIFSQWFKVPVIDPVADIKGVCAEQLMMAHKAILFNDLEARDKILATSNAAEQKAIGRTVKNFDPAIWDQKKLSIVTDISFYKFTQNPKLRDLIIMTDGFVLVEASPEDKVWGVGLSEHDPLILDKENWKGENLLGIALMKARSFIIANIKGDE